MEKVDWARKKVDWEKEALAFNNWPREEIGFLKETIFRKLHFAFVCLIYSCSYQTNGKVIVG